MIFILINFFIVPYFTSFFFQWTDKLLDYRISKISCNFSHVVAIDVTGNFFVWGKNSQGALGLKKIYSVVFPRKLNTTIKDVSKIVCANDCTAVLTKNGEVFVTGRNKSNRFGFGEKLKVIESFRKISCIKRKVVDLSIATNHSAYVLDGGYVLTIGDNKDGQLGQGHTKRLKNSAVVKKLSTKYITVSIDRIYKSQIYLQLNIDFCIKISFQKVMCYNTYTTVISDCNVLMIFGTRLGIPEFQINEIPPTPDQATSFTQVSNNTIAFTNFLTSVYRRETIIQPKELLGLYSSSEMLEKGIYIKFQEILPLEQCILISIDTTAPLKISN